MASIRLQDVARQYNNTIAIERITFAVPDGEFWVLVGPSGCGKSTILRTIAGLERVSRGEIYIGDRIVTQIPARDRDVAMVFQNYALYPHMTVAENLSFGLRMRKADRESISQRIGEIARSLAIEHLLDRKPKQLSGGQQQRVALGRAIARQPRVFLLDEPLSNLDAQLRESTREELKHLHKRFSTTALYVTHDQVEAMTLGDKIIVLDRGCIQQIGTPREIYENPVNRMVATFLGSPPMNIFPATHQGETWAIASQSLPCPTAMRTKLLNFPQRQLDLGIRPEGIRAIASGGLQVFVTAIEPLGRETLVVGQLPETEVFLRFYLPGSWQGTLGECLNLHLDPEHLFVFDRQSGERL